MEEFLEFAFPRTGLQKLDEFNAQCIIQPLPCLKGQAKELHPELMPLDPLNLAKLNRQGLGMIGEQDAHADIAAAEDLSIGHDRASHQRQVG